MDERLKLIVESLNIATQINDIFNDWFFIENESGQIVFMSASCETFTGYSKEELLANPSIIESIITNITETSKYDKSVQNSIDTEKIVTKKDGTFVYVSRSIKPIFALDTKQYIGKHTTISDISKYYYFKQRAQLSVKILNILNSSTNIEKSIGEVLDVIKIETEHDLVLIRCKEYDDYSIYFSSQNKLAKKNQKALCPCKDAKDSHNCLYMQIFKCKSNQKKTHKLNYSCNSSFWVNDVNELLPHYKIESAPSKCVHSPYKSFAFIPIINNKTIIGYLQVSDKKQNAFNSAIINSLENITKNLSLALQRKTIEDNLKKNEEFNRRIVETNNQGILVLDISQKILYINYQMSQLIGYSYDELVNKNYRDFLIIDEISDYDAQIKQILNGEPITYERKIRKKDGTIITTLVTAQALTDDQGRIKGAFAMLLDISERKNTELALAKSEYRYRLLADNVKDVVWVLDTKSMKMIYLSPSVYKQRGYTVDEILESPELENLLTPKYFKILKKRIPKRASDFLEGKIGEENHFTSYIQQPCKDGRIIWSEIVASYYYNKENERVELVGIARDCTERKIAEEKISILMQAIENSPVCVMICDNNGQIQYANPKFVELTGYSLEESINQNYALSLSSNNLKESLEQVKKEIKSGHNWVGTLKSEKKNGEFFWELLSVSPIKNGNKITNAVIIREDITERVEYEHNLRTYLDKLRVSEENLQNEIATKDKFFSILAHDLKNPLGSMRELSLVLWKEFNEFTESERMDIIQAFHESSKMVYDLLENLLTWARSQTNKLEYRPEDVNIHYLIESTINLLKLTFEKKNISVDIKVEENLTAYIDPNLIITVIRNLISNAIKFTPEDGTIIVASNIEENMIVISVADSGVGMTQETINKLFRIDESLSTIGTNSEKGTGLGLILCKEFVEMHDGSIWIESEVGKGSTVFFTIPKKFDELIDIN